MSAPPQEQEAADADPLAIGLLLQQRARRSRFAVSKSASPAALEGAGEVGPCYPTLPEVRAARTLLMPHGCLTASKMSAPPQEQEAADADPLAIGLLLQSASPAALEGAGEVGPCYPTLPEVRAARTT
jgi:hypothetical protein